MPVCADRAGTVCFKRFVPPSGTICLNAQSYLIVCAMLFPAQRQLLPIFPDRSTYAFERHPNDNLPSRHFRESPDGKELQWRLCLKRKPAPPPDWRPDSECRAPPLSKIGLRRREWTGGMSKPGIETQFRERRSVKTTAVDRRSNAGSMPEPKDQTVRDTAASFPQELLLDIRCAASEGV